MANKHVFLMFNMGNSGGKWFEDICNIHEDVEVWQEANHYLKVDHLDNQLQLDRVYDFFMEQYKTNQNKTIGLNKAFDERLVKFAGTVGGSIMQMFRHPIGVVNFKIGHKMGECQKRGMFDKIDTPKKKFEAHTEFYASRYQTYTDNSHKWPIIRLEDLKNSIVKETPYFVNTMKKALKVDWQPKHTKKVINMGGLKEDFSHLKIWEDWDDWKKKIFLKYFEKLMRTHNYKWGVV